MEPVSEIRQAVTKTLPLCSWAQADPAEIRAIPANRQKNRKLQHNKLLMKFRYPPGDRLTRLLILSGENIGAEQLRSVQRNAAACSSSGYCTSGFGKAPSFWSHHSTRL